VIHGKNKDMSSSTETAHSSNRVSAVLVPLAVLLPLAVAVRAISLYYASLIPLFSHYRLDAKIYHASGLLLQSGDWLMGNEVFHLSPLYCYLLGMIYAVFGEGPWPVHTIQVLIGCATVSVVFDTARRLFGGRWAWLAGLAACFYGPLIFYEGHLLVATAAVFLHAVFIWCAVRCFSAKNASLLAWFAAGAVLGLCALARPNALLLFFPFLAVLFGMKRIGPFKKRLRAFEAVLLGAALLIVPFTLRNLFVAGEFVLLQDKGGINLYIGNGPDATGSQITPGEVPEAGTVVGQVVKFREKAELEMGGPLTSGEVDSFWYRKTLDAVLADPGRWVRLLGLKLRLYVCSQEISNNYDYSFTRDLNPLLGLPLLQFFPVIPFAVLGTFALLFTRRKEDLFLSLFNITLCAAVVLFFVVSRYRLPAVPGLILAAVAGLRFVILRFQNRSWVSAACAVLCFAAISTVSLMPVMRQPKHEEYLKLGHLYHLQGLDAEKAEWAYLKAIESEKGYLPAHKHLAVLYEEQGRTEEAISRWRKVHTIAARTGPARVKAQAADHIKALNELIQTNQ